MKKHHPSSSSSTKPAHTVLPYQTSRLRDHYHIGKKLGQGQFGTTYLCINKATSKQYACKSIPKRKLLCKEDYEDVWREIQIMHHLSEHPHVVQIKGTYEDSMFVHLVMELCAGGELFDRIVAKGHYSEKEAAKLIKTIVGVVEACHSLGVMHRDLKPENFLFDTPGDDAKLRATDFGLSVFYKPGQYFSDVVGSPYYVAPEVLLKLYGPEVDVWSAGVILYILLSGVPPFWAETESGIFRQILKGKIDFESEPWPNISENAKDLIRKMLERDPRRRISAHEVLCNPWIVDDRVAPDKPLDSAVLTRLKKFSAMHKLKKMALRVIAERLSEEEIGGLKELFKMIDTDNSGTITFEELKVGLKRVGSELTECEIKDLMEAADIDNSGTIDYGEFLAATLHLNKMEREENLVAAFAYFDKDGSGYITVDELQQAPNTISYYQSIINMQAALSIAPPVLPLKSKNLSQATVSPPKLGASSVAPRGFAIKAAATVAYDTDASATVDYSSLISVFPAEACETIGGDACLADIFPEAKLERDARNEAARTASEPYEREYLEYNEAKTVFRAEACDDLGGEFCEREYQRGVY